MMTPILPNRRAALIGLGASLAAMSLPAFAQTRPLMQVVKDPDCGCCSAWINIMQQSGFDMGVANVSYEQLLRIKAANGITEDMASCHTGLVDGYIIEGHVPPADVKRLLSERPDAIGLSVPGMPYGSPGMGPETERETYAVILIRKDGTQEVFSSYAAAS